MFLVDRLPLVRRLACLLITLLSLLGVAASPSLVRVKSATVAPLLRLLESGWLPAEQRPWLVPVAGLLCRLAKGLGYFSSASAISPRSLGCFVWRHAIR